MGDCHVNEFKYMILVYIVNFSLARCRFVKNKQTNKQAETTTHMKR